MVKTLTVIAMMVLAITSTAFAEEALNHMCTVTGRVCDGSISTTVEGETFYFSSQGAKRLFQMRPERYTNTAGEQKLCPVMGGKINKNISTDYKGRKVYFCCAGCIATFEANPQKYLKKLGPAPKTTIPVKKNNKKADAADCGSSDCDDSSSSTPAQPSDCSPSACSSCSGCSR